MNSRPNRAMLAEFFAQFHITADGCWEWVGELDHAGYGVFRSRAAYRVSHEWFVGPIAAEFHVDHLCFNRPCVNPAHLEAVTASENARRSWRRRAQSAVDMLSMDRPPCHPGEVFDREFIEPSGISQGEAARRMGMSTNRLNEIAKRKRAVTAETALLFGALSRTDPRLWFYMQKDYDLWQAAHSPGMSKRIEAVAASL